MKNYSKEVKYFSDKNLHMHCLWVRGHTVRNSGINNSSSTSYGGIDVFSTQGAVVLTQKEPLGRLRELVPKSHQAGKSEALKLLH
jgi:hypothetical protein